MAQSMQTSCRKIFQRRAPSIGLPKLIFRMFGTTPILKPYFPLSSLLSSCLPERSLFLTSGHQEKFSAGFCWRRMTLQSVAEFSIIHLKIIWFIIYTISVRKKNSLPRHYVKLNSAERDGSSMYSLQ